VTLPLAQKNELLVPFDAIFQDAFSPKKNPTLWSVEWFSFLKSASRQNVQLSTYSSSISIRKSLLAAGWSIENARGFALKRTMTKANLMKETSKEILMQLDRSPSLEIHDK
jgi:tRNA U34 5-methylaminomethyl-2-thiouridine-forming methyltransferase MnmC